MEKQDKKYLTAINILGVVLVLVNLTLISWNWKLLPPKLPWFFSLPWGEEQLVSKVFLVGFCLGEIALWQVFQLLTKKVKGGDQEITVALLLGGLTALLLITISLVKIITIFI